VSEETELAERIFDALRRDDMAAFGRLVSGDIEITTARGLRQGHAEALAWARNKYDYLQRRFAIDEMRPLPGGGLLALGRAEYAWKDSGEVGDSTPVAIELRFRDGRMICWRFRDDLA
jgi:ketosteroid isomerase-like protein